MSGDKCLTLNDILANWLQGFVRLVVKSLVCAMAKLESSIVAHEECNSAREYAIAMSVRVIDFTFHYWSPPVSMTSSLALDPGNNDAEASVSVTS